MSDTRSNTRHLTSISQAEVDAMKALDSDTLSGLVTMVYLLTSDDDVREHACIIVASLYSGANDADGPTGQGQHAARAAVRIAQRAVTASRTLDRWDMYGDLTEEVATALESYGVASHVTRYAPDPATAYAPTMRDLVTTLANQHGMRTACEAYLSHARTCEACTGADSHRVTLAGVRAHLDGRGADDASYHSERRAMLRTLASVGTFSDLARMIDDPAPLAPAHAPHGSVNLGNIRKPSTRDHLAPVRTVTRDRSTVTTARTVTVTRTVHGGHTVEDTPAVRRAQRAFDRAVRQQRAHARATLSALGITRTAGDARVRPIALDHLGYPLRHGYGVDPAGVDIMRDALDRATLAALTYGEDTTRTESRIVTTATTERSDARAMLTTERDALTATEARAARYAGESYSGGTHAPVSGQADTFGHAPHAEANTGRATTPGDALPSGAVPVSPRKRARTGSTGPTVPIW